MLSQHFPPTPDDVVIYGHSPEREGLKTFFVDPAYATEYGLQTGDMFIIQENGQGVCTLIPQGLRRVLSHPGKFQEVRIPDGEGPVMPLICNINETKSRAAPAIRYVM